MACFSDNSLCYFRQFWQFFSWILLGLLVVGKKGRKNWVPLRFQHLIPRCQVNLALSIVNSLFASSNIPLTIVTCPMKSIILILIMLIRLFCLICLICLICLLYERLSPLRKFPFPPPQMSYVEDILKYIYTIILMSLP